MGLDTFFDKSFADHVDLASIPAEDRQQYLDDWGQPGALTAMLNWYRASRMIVPAAGEQADRPRLGRCMSPEIKVPVHDRLGAATTRRCCRSSSTGSAEVGDDVDRRHPSQASAISRRGRRPDQVASRSAALPAGGLSG